METIFYVVKRIDGDYAFLINTAENDGEEKCVARALLPETINEGSCLRYEMFSYEIVE